MSDRACQGVDLLLDGYVISDQLNASPVTEENLPYYFDGGAEREQLFLEEANSTWTNATNIIDIMEDKRAGMLGIYLV